VIAWWVVFAGVGVVVLCALPAVTLPAVLDRLHLLTAATSRGAPVIGLGLMISQGLTQASAMVTVITALVVVTALAMSASTGRLTVPAV
jgi:multisubunit Na+/H+ antiporter MnhG subunit